MSGRESRGKGRDRGVVALGCEARHRGSRKIGGRESIGKFERRGKMAEEERTTMATELDGRNHGRAERGLKMIEGNTSSPEAG